MSDWQPIETAPKDGTVILLRYADHSLSGYPQRMRDQRRVGVGYFAGLWEASVPGGHSTGGGDSQFAHWMPLPEPPASADTHAERHDPAEGHGPKDG